MAQHPKWNGQCTTCSAWNTLVEDVMGGDSPVVSKTVAVSRSLNSASQPLPIGDIAHTSAAATPTGISEFDRVLDGGLVPGSVTLVSGEPGIGKSTLMLQIALMLNQTKILYVSGEESESQIKMRAERMPLKSENCYVLSETNTQAIFQQIEALDPDILVIDSIQTLHSKHVESAAGSVSQVRECTAELMKFAKETGTPVFLVGHITKDGAIAGPKVLEHMVDTVLQFEGDRHLTYRILRTSKNRFGSTHELGIYEMAEKGLQIVENPSQMLMSNRDEGFSGITITANMEGVRALFIETQALVSGAAYGNPQRSATGFDLRRMNMLLAVLEKKCGYKVGTEDVFLNITGGIKIEDPATDLAVLAAIVSSREDIPVPNDVCFAGEVGLSGEVRPVQKIDIRIKEAEKLGFSTIFVSKYNKISLKETLIQVKLVAKIEDVVSELFG